MSRNAGASPGASGRRPGRGRAAMGVAIAVMAALAFVWLSYEGWRYVGQADRIGGTSIVPGAIDLRLRHLEVQTWFSGWPVYGELEYAVYPPATYAMLWPLLGWLPWSAAHAGWGLVMAAALVWLVRLVVRESGARTLRERAFVGLLPLSTYAAGAAIGNGQLIVVLLPLLVAGISRLGREPRRWRHDLLAGLLVLGALAKPNVGVPFFWLVLWVPRTVRPAAVAVAGYAALTLLASSFQPGSVLTQLEAWITGGKQAAVEDGYANVHTWLAASGQGSWVFSGSLLLLVALGIWTWFHRRRDVWLLLGVTAIVARLWTAHRWYDDLLLLLPMVTLFRLARAGTGPGGRAGAGLLLALMVGTGLAPGGRFLLPSPWNAVHANGQAVLWCVILAYLVVAAYRDRPGLHSSPASLRPPGSAPPAA